MKSNNADIGICGTIIEYENGTKKIRKNDKIEVLDAKEAMIRINSFSYFSIEVWNKLYKRKIVSEIKFPIGKKSEDYFVMYKYFENAQNIVLLPEAKYHYYQRKNSISRSVNINFDYIEGSEKQKKFIDTKYPDISFVGNTAYAFSYITIFNICIDQGVKLDKKNKLKFKKEVQKNLKDVIKNRYIKIQKKFQAIIFATSLNIYSFIIKKVKNY